jgi:hypothetical protein
LREAFKKKEFGYPLLSKWNGRFIQRCFKKAGKPDNNKNKKENQRPFALRKDWHEPKNKLPVERF